MQYQNRKASDRYKPRHALRPPYAADRKEPRKEPCGGHLLRQAPLDKRGHHRYANQEQCDIALDGWIPVLHCGSRPRVSRPTEAMADAAASNLISFALPSILPRLPRPAPPSGGREATLRPWRVNPYPILLEDHTLAQYPGQSR